MNKIVFIKVVILFCRLLRVEGLDKEKSKYSERTQDVIIAFLYSECDLELGDTIN